MSARAKCRAGDAAMYVGRHEASAGMIVRCVRLMTWADRLRPMNRGLPAAAWLIDPPLIRDDGGRARFAADAALLPIRASGVTP